MIHQHCLWNMVATVNHWPFFLVMANNSINESSSLQNKAGQSTLQIFSNIQVQSNTKYWIPFGCLVYVLGAALHSGRGIHNKWEYHSKVVIYLGRSPNHGRNVALVLDCTTGLVSPQFLVTFYPIFYTIKKDEFDTHWQTNDGFLIDEKTKKSKKQSIY